MKRILLIIFSLFICVAAAAQKPWRSASSAYVADMPFDESGELVFSEVVEIPNATSQDLYAAAVTFVCSSYNSPSTVIKSSAPPSEIMVSAEANCDMCGFLGADVLIKYEMTIQCKEGRYRYAVRITSIDNTSPRVTFAKNGGNEKGKVKNRTIEVAENLALELRAYMRFTDWKMEAKRNEWKNESAEYSQFAPFTPEGLLIYAGVQETPNASHDLEGKMHSLEGRLAQISIGKPEQLYNDRGAKLTTFVGKSGSGNYVTTYQATVIVKENKYKYLIEALLIGGVYPGKYIKSALTKGSEERLAGNVTEVIEQIVQAIQLSMTETRSADAWNMGEKKNDWKSEDPETPADLPFTKSGMLLYTGVLAAPGDSFDHFEKARKFIAITFLEKQGGTNSLVDRPVENESTGTIRVRARSVFGQGGGPLSYCVVNFEFRLQFANGKCKYEIEITDAMDGKKPREYFTAKDRSKYISLMNASFDELVQQLAVNLKTSNKPKKDDW